MTGDESDLSADSSPSRSTMFSNRVSSIFMHADLVAIVDAAYTLDVPESEWLEGVFRAAEPALDRGRGMYAFSYDASTRGNLKLGDVREKNVARPVSNTPEGRLLLANVEPAFVEATYLSATCGLASETLAFAGVPAKYLEAHGIKDVHVINARDPSGRGWVFGGYLPKLGVLSGRERTTWSRIAAHLAAAHRLRTRARETDNPRLSVTGELEDGDAFAKRARHSLRSAVVSYERVHAKASQDPEGAMREWRVLVDARWTLVDGFERDGTRYVVARRNDSEGRGPKALSTRERQVLNLAALGQSNKLIAYELGISHATVRVLIARAAAKLGATSRLALLRTYRLALTRLP